MVHRGQAHCAHLLVNTDRAVVQPGRLERGPHRNSLASTCSVSFDGLDLGRLDLGSSTAAGPSARARLHSSLNDLREMPCSMQNVETAPAVRRRAMRDRKADTGVNRFMGGHHGSLTTEVSPPRTPTA